MNLNQTFVNQNTCSNISKNAAKLHVHIKLMHRQVKCTKSS